MNLTSISSVSYHEGLPPQYFSEQYNYPAGQKNGQVSSITEGTGETVVYQYDMLKRLTGATASGWTQSYIYDGFGNMTAKSGSFNMLVDPMTNHVAGLPNGWYYDGNGNLYQGYYWGYDMENRLVSVDAAGNEQYA